MKNRFQTVQLKLVQVPALALNITRYGSKIFANVFDHQKDNPKTAPPNVPAKKPPIVDIEVK